MNFCGENYILQIRKRLSYSWKDRLDRMSNIKKFKNFPDLNENFPTYGFFLTIFSNYLKTNLKSHCSRLSLPMGSPVGKCFKKKLLGINFELSK